MIGYLFGSIKEKFSNNLIIDVNGVGYEVFIPLYTLNQCKLNETKAFYIYTHVREDTLALFGFSTKEDKNIFMNLISVSGIGPKTALNILSSSQGAINIIKAISNADVDFFTSIKGIGKKSGQRIIVDLKSKIGGLKDLDFENAQDSDLIEVLKGLGFSNEEIKKSTKNISKKLKLEDKIKLALKK